MDILEGIMLNEMSDREKQILNDLMYMWNLKSKQTRTKLKHTENPSPSVARGKGWEEGKMDKGGQKVQTFSYKISKWGLQDYLPGCNTQDGDYDSTICIFESCWKSKSQSASHRKKNFLKYIHI